jgi:hypothetical protein
MQPAERQLPGISSLRLCMSLMLLLVQHSVLVQWRQCCLPHQKVFLWKMMQCSLDRCTHQWAATNPAQEDDVYDRLYKHADQTTVQTTKMHSTQWGMCNDELVDRAWGHVSHPHHQLCMCAHTEDRDTAVTFIVCSTYSVVERTQRRGLTCRMTVDCHLTNSLMIPTAIIFRVLVDFSI